MAEAGTEDDLAIVIETLSWAERALAVEGVKIRGRHEWSFVFSNLNRIGHCRHESLYQSLLLPVNTGLAFVPADIILLIRWDLVAPKRGWFPLVGRNRRDALSAFDFIPASIANSSTSTR